MNYVFSYSVSSFSLSSEADAHSPFRNNLLVAAIAPSCIRALTGNRGRFMLSQQLDATNHILNLGERGSCLLWYVYVMPQSFNANNKF